MAYGYNMGGAAMAALNQGPGDQADLRARNEMQAAGIPYRTPSGAVDTGAVSAYRQGVISSIANQMKNTSAPKPAAPRVVSTGGSSSARRSSGGRSGGGGGKVAAPQMSQAMIDWLANLMKSGAPQAMTANTLDLPDYQQVAYRDFDPTLFNQNRAALASAGAQDLNTINTSRDALLNFLNTNYKNAYANPDVGSGGPMLGTSQADMSRMLAAQGVNQVTPGQTSVMNEAARAQQMAGDWRQAMSANEDQAQRNRLVNAQGAATQQQLALAALQRSLGLGIDQSQTQAQSQWQQAADQWNENQRQIEYQTQQQEAMQNWQNQNSVQSANAAAQAAYHNEVLQAMLQLATSNVGNKGITLPTMQALGLA